MAEPTTSHAKATVQAPDDVVKPPIPKVLYKVLNPAMAAILRSPAHRLLSGWLMVLSFTGRKTGKRYAIPVGYLQEGDRLQIFSHAGWWRNLPGETVTLRLRGRDVHATARRIEDRQEIAALVRKVVANRGEPMAARMGLLDYADPERPGPLPQRTKFFELALEEPVP